MKRKIILGFIGLLIIFVGILTYKKINTNNSDLTNIKIAEVTHSAFYAPLYIAIENDYFKDEGLDVELILTSGADKVSAAVLSKDVEIGFAGAESAVYIYNGGEKDYLQVFSGLTKRDGQFIVSRKNEKNFDIKDLIGKEVLVGRKGGMPALNFINALNNSGIDIKEVNLNYSVEFAALSGSFIGGVGDYVNLFEPNATLLESEEYGYTVASIGLLSGEFPYTTFYARKNYIKNNEEIIEKFTNAINKALKYTNENKPEIIAKDILPQFPDTSLNDLTTIIKRYKEADSWQLTPYVTKESYNNLQKLLIDNDLIKDYVPYKKIVNNFYNE